MFFGLLVGPVCFGTAVWLVSLFSFHTVCLLLFCCLRPKAFVPCIVACYLAVCKNENKNDYVIGAHP